VAALLADEIPKYPLKGLKLRFACLVPFASGRIEIASFAGKPVTLKMLINTFHDDGDLPANGLDLYEKGCSILCEEQNESRRAVRRLGFLSPKDRVAVASR
jgi:hypothetical protein